MVRALALLLLLASGAHAQTVQPDSTQSAPADTVRTDTTRAAPIAGVRLAPPAEGGLEEPVVYAARDSVVIAVARTDAPADSSGDVVTLYGNAQATYRTATIAAALLEYQGRAQSIRAEGLGADTTGTPRFRDGDNAFTGRLFSYNLATQRGRVSGARTQIQDGFLLGGIYQAGGRPRDLRRECGLHDVRA